MPAVSAYYAASIEDFLGADADRVLGALAREHGFSLEPLQKRAWQDQFGMLQSALRGIDGTLYLEFKVPRLGTRIDAVLVSKDAVFPIEFKCGESRYLLADRNQVWDYALDLKNFHFGSHGADIFPILVATEAPAGDPEWQASHADGVRPPRSVNGIGLPEAIRSALQQVRKGTVDSRTWGSEPYRPTPTIIEAARALFARHAVEEIARHDAGAKNLGLTSAAVDHVIARTQQAARKSIVFVTGVPGAGKTLVGLNVATSHRSLGDAHAVFLSGNGPLVAVLREALTRDELSRRPGVRKGVVQQEVKPFIQNIHHFRDEGLRDISLPPDDHVVIFDEAQRAWNLEQTASFMKRKKGLPDFRMSEPQFLLSYMDRRPDWAVVICLVGGGQEINTGEAGIGAWLEALEGFPNWDIYVSPNLTDSEYAVASDLRTLGSRVSTNADLHLSTSMRSFRSENVSTFVKALLDLDTVQAAATLDKVLKRYPIVVSRDLRIAKDWVRTKARGNERYGLLASSSAHRLKPHAIDIRVDVDPVHWFLNDRSDTRSSFYLEDAATEFQVQGLELDWMCVSWDADLRLEGGSWKFQSFRGDGWSKVHKQDRQRYLLNAYRVLLTRARQGMALFVPKGDPSDATRAPHFYDETFDYLHRLGIPQI